MKNKELWLLIFLSLVVILPGLDNFYLQGRDENFYAEAAREMMIRGDYFTPYYNNEIFADKPPLTYWFIILGYNIFGVNELGARFFPALFNIATLIILYFFSHLIFKNSTKAFLSSAILFSSFLFFVIANGAICDGFLIFFITTSLYCFFLGEKKGKFYYYLLSYFCIALATLSKGLIGVIFPAAIIFFYFLSRKKLSGLKKIYLPAGIIIFLAVCVPVFLLSGKDFLQQFFYREHIQRFVSARESHHGGFWYYPVSIIYGFLPWSVFIIQSCIYSWKKIARDEKYFLFLWGGLILIFFSFSQTKLPHYLLPIYPMLAMVSAYFFSDFFNEENLGKKYKLIISYSFLVVISLIIFLALFFVEQGLILKQYQGFINLTLVINFGVFFAGSLGGLLFYLYHKRIASFLSIFSGTIIFFLILTNFSLPQFDLKKNTIPLAKDLALNLDEDDLLLSYNFLEPEQVFYSKHQIIRVDTPQQLEEYLLSGEGKEIFCFVRADDYAKIGKGKIIFSRTGLSPKRKFENLLVVKL